jgi:hypothetical protein
MVCRPLEQKRLTVAPATVTGRPARSATWRAMLAPVAPSGLAQDVLDLAALDAGALDRRLDGVAAQLGAVRHVEGTLPALAERRAGGGNDDGVGHLGTPGIRIKG